MGCSRASTEELALWWPLNSSLNYWVRCWGGMGAQAGGKGMLMWNQKACANGLGSGGMC